VVWLGSESEYRDIGTTDNNAFKSNKCNKFIRLKEMTFKNSQPQAPKRRTSGRPSSTVKSLTIVAFAAVNLFAASASIGRTLEPHENILATATQTILEMPEVRTLSNPSIKPNNLDNRLRLTRCSEPLSAEVTSRYMRGGRLTVDVACNGTQPWSIYVPVTITSEIQVLTLIQALPRDAIITEGDVDVVTLRRRPTGLPTLSDPKQAIGLAAKRALSEGTELRPTMLKQPVIIKRGDQTVITAGSGGLSVRMTGKALEDGVLGEQIRVQNLSSKRTIQGEVQRDGSVLIGI
jgi:flagella basal body P-ring formation protein FlgA